MQSVYQKTAEGRAFNHPEIVANWPVARTATIMVTGHSEDRRNLAGGSLAGSPARVGE